MSAAKAREKAHSLPVSRKYDLTVNCDDQQTVLWIDHKRHGEIGKLILPTRDARPLVSMLLDEGFSIRAYWKDCTARERMYLDKRIGEGRWT